MKHERGDEPEIVLVSPGTEMSCGPLAGPGRPPEGPCRPMIMPCNPQCAPGCMPSSLPCRPQIPCYPEVGKPPKPPSPPGPNQKIRFGFVRIFGQFWGYLVKMILPRIDAKSWGDLFGSITESSLFKFFFFSSIARVFKRFLVNKSMFFSCFSQKCSLAQYSVQNAKTSPKYAGGGKRNEKFLIRFCMLFEV